MATGKVYDVFFCHTPNSNFVFPNGQLAVFIGGRYATDDPAKAAYLQYEIDQGNPSIHRKEDCMQLAQEDLAPDSEYRKRVIADYLAAENAKKLAPPAMGDYEPGKLNPTNSQQLIAGAADSSSAANSAATSAPVAINLASISTKTK